MRLVAELFRRCESRGDPCCLLPAREQIREIERIAPLAALSFVAARAKDDSLRCLVVWLRGRCGRTLGTRVIAQFASSPDRMLRKHVVRALARMHAWSQLREIASRETDPQIRHLATSSPSAPYPDRLAGFVQHVTARPPADAFRRLTVAHDVDFAGGKPPRPGWLIRTILERIHQLVTQNAGKGKPRKLRLHQRQ